jgi:hypothetical protein
MHFLQLCAVCLLAALASCRSDGAVFVDLHHPSTSQASARLPLEAALMPQKHGDHQPGGVFAKHAAESATQLPQPAVLLRSIEPVISMGSSIGQVHEAGSLSHITDPFGRHHGFGHGFLSFGGWRRGSRLSVDGARSTSSQHSSLDSPLGPFRAAGTMPQRGSVEIPVGFTKAAAAMPQRSSLDSPQGSAGATAAVQQRSSLDSPHGSTGATAAVQQPSSLDSPQGSVGATAAVQQRSSLDSPKGFAGATAAVQQRSSLDSPHGSAGAATTAHRDMTLAGFLQQHGAIYGLEKHGADPAFGSHPAVSAQSCLASPTSPRGSLIDPQARLSAHGPAHGHEHPHAHGLVGQHVHDSWYHGLGIHAGMFDRHRRSSHLSHISHLLPTVAESPIRTDPRSSSGQATQQQQQAHAQAAVSVWDRLKFWKGSPKQGSATALPDGLVPQFHHIPVAGASLVAKQSTPAGEFIYSVAAPNCAGGWLRRSCLQRMNWQPRSFNCLSV